MTNIGTKLYSFFSGKHVGTDLFGNRYYTEKRATKTGKRRRWVLYKGIVEPSKVPPLWHGWLHYVTDEIPVEGKNYAWQKLPIPNLTGTTLAYKPPGYATLKKECQQPTGEYEAWNP